jgi:IstB-like ATP binding protein
MRTSPSRTAAADMHVCWRSGRRPTWLLVDDFAMAPMSDGAGRDLLEILDDRHGHRSTLVTSQIPVENYRINLSGESMRKGKRSLTSNPQSE